MATVAQPTTNTQANTTVTPQQGNLYFMNGGAITPQGTAVPPPKNVTPNNTNAQTTSIIGAGQATDHYLGAQNFLNQTQTGVANQAQTNAQNQANTAANSQTQGNTTQGANQPTGSQGTTNNGTLTGQPDNTDLKASLDAATKALGGEKPDETAYKQNVSDLNSQEKDVQTKLDKINSDIATSSDQFQQSVNAIQSGTFPLTPAQTASLQQTQQAVNQLNQSAQQQAQIYAQAATTFGAVHGLAQFNPGAAQQAISAAMAKGQAEIAKAELDGTKQLADLQKGFADDDFNMISKSYDALQKSLDSKQKIMNDLSTNIQKQITDAQTQYKEDYNNYKTDLQNAITNVFKGQTLSDTEKKNLFDESMSKANFDEKQKQDLVTNYYKGITASQNATRIGIEQQNANTSYQHLLLDKANAASATADASAAAANARVTTPDGKSFINGTGLDAKAKAQALKNNQIVLEGDNVKAVTSINNTQTELGNLIGSLKSAGALDANGNVIGAGRTSPFELKAWTAGNAVPSVTNFANALTGTGTSGTGGLITELEKLPGTGDLVSTLRDNIPAKGDDATTLQNKISTITTALSDSENSYFTNASPSSQPNNITYNGKTYNVDSQGNMTPQ